jgi:hypothetical protein
VNSTVAAKRTETTRSGPDGTPRLRPTLHPEGHEAALVRRARLAEASEGAAGAREKARNTLYPVSGMSSVSG